MYANQRLSWLQVRRHFFTEYLQRRQDHGLVTSLAPGAHAKILATAAALPHASVLKVIHGKMLTILASVSNKQCTLMDVLEKPRQAST